MIPLYNKIVGDNRVVKKIEQYLHDKPGILALILLIPGSIWLAAFLFSFLLILIYSFLQPAPTTPETTITIDQYFIFLRSPVYTEIVIDSFKTGLIVTIATLVLSYPPAYYLAMVREKRKNMLLILLILPFWINVVVRTFAWRLILSRNGLVNWVMIDIIGLYSEPKRLLFTEGAIILGLIHVFLPFMIIPLYTSMNRIDKSLIESSKILGANKLQTFYEVTLPQSLPGIGAGAVIVFVLSAGSYVVPDMLGGARNILIANAIADFFGIALDWGIGSAIAVTFSLLIFVIVYIFNKYIGIESLYGGNTQ